MRILIRKYKKRERKINHIKFLENRITLLHNEIVNDAIYKKVNYTKAKLLKKYNRRLQLLLY
jgi:hypothetical protein